MKNRSLYLRTFERMNEFTFKTRTFELQNQLPNELYFTNIILFENLQKFIFNYKTLIGSAHKAVGIEIRK